MDVATWNVPVQRWGTLNQSAIEEPHKPGTPTRSPAAPHVTSFDIPAYWLVLHKPELARRYRKAAIRSRNMAESVFPCIVIGPAKPFGRGIMETTWEDCSSLSLDRLGWFMHSFWLLSGRVRALEPGFSLSFKCPTVRR